MASYDRRTLLDFLVAQNESLVHDAKFNAMMLRSQLACFGEQSQAVTELVQQRKERGDTVRCASLRDCCRGARQIGRLCAVLECCGLTTSRQVNNSSHVTLTTTTLRCSSKMT